MNSINTNTALQDTLGTAPQAKKSDGEMGKEQFMQLMLAQLNNQDPMSPMENGDFLAQIAQFSTVTGIEGLQSSFDSFSASMQANQALQASTLVGREVLIPGEFAALNAGGTVNGALQLPAATSSSKLNVYSRAGEQLGSVTLGPAPAGQQAFSWSGRLDDGTQLPAGDYVIQAEAVIDGKVEAVESLVGARVDSVSLGQYGQEPVLNLANIGPMGFSQVREIR